MRALLTTSQDVARKWQPSPCTNSGSRVKITRGAARARVSQSVSQSVREARELQTSVGQNAGGRHDDRVQHAGRACGLRGMHSTPHAPVLAAATPPHSLYGAADKHTIIRLAPRGLATRTPHSRTHTHGAHSSHMARCARQGAPHARASNRATQATTHAASDAQCVMSCRCTHPLSAGRAFWSGVAAHALARARRRHAPASLGCDACTRGVTTSATVAARNND